MIFAAARKSDDIGGLARVRQPDFFAGPTHKSFNGKPKATTMVKNSPESSPTACR